MILTNSKRLSYSKMSRDDAELFYELDQDIEVMRYINGGKLPTMEEIQDVYIPRLESYNNEEKGWGIWKVSLTENNYYLGWIIVRPMYFFSDNPELDNLELGWRFKRECWGKGYATEAALSVQKALIALGNIKKLSAIAFEDNIASTNIMIKLGMKYIKTDIHQDPLGDYEVVFYEQIIV